MKLPTCRIAILATSLGLAGLVPISIAHAQGYRFTDLGAPGGAVSSANAISNNGLITGLTYAAGAANSHATFWNSSGGFDLGTLGGSFSSGMAINNQGQIAGFAADGRATLWQGGNGSVLGTLGGAHSYASGINNAGQVVGESYIDQNNVIFHATLWQAGAAIDLGTLGGRFSAANSINDLGQAVGRASVADNSGQHAALWSGGHVLDLGTLGGNYSTAWAINDNGIVAGQSDYVASGIISEHATLWRNGHIVDLGTLPGGAESLASAVNLGGQVVGYSFYGSSSAPHAILWQNDAMIDLNTLLPGYARQAGWVLNAASGINDYGWIVGSAWNAHTGATHAYLLAPVPEPSSWAMLLGGLCALIWVARRRTRHLSADDTGKHPLSAA